MDKRKDKQIAVKVISVIASFVLWIYVANVENPPRKDNVKVNVILKNKESLTERRLALLPGAEPTVTLRLEGPSTIINVVDAEDFEVVADLNAYVLGKGSKPVPVEIVKSPANVNVLNEGSLTVTLKFDELIDKIVPVKTDIEVDTKSGFMAFQPLPRPTSVYVSGPAQYVNSVSYVLASDLKNNVDTDVQMSVPLKAMDEAGRPVNEVTIEPKVVDIVVNVKKVKSVGISVDIKEETLPGSLAMKSIESSLDKIDIAGDDEVLNNISSIRTEPIDLSKITGSDKREVKLIVPEGVTLVENSGTVNVSINVEKMVSRGFMVDIKVRNLGEDYNANLDKSRTTITLRGPESKINSVDSDSINCYVDLGNFGEMENQPVNVEVTNIPEGLIFEGAKPNSISISITRKSVPTGTTPSDTGGTTQPSETTPPSTPAP